jgi:dihydrodipicolinate synthase/N-acetylneuraminate lyase
MHWSAIPPSSLAVLRAGAVIPAHLLALDKDRKLNARRQRALTRYYLDAGAGGVAVGVHSTQFTIREAGLYTPVLELAMQTSREWVPLGGARPLFMIAGLAGKTEEARREALTAREIGYHAGLLSLAAMKGASEDELIAHCRAVADIMPIVGFYLQPAVGGIALDARFWRRFAEIDNVVAIKMAPFNRYHTLDVLRGVVAARAEERITLYTGNDDHIVLDLLAPFSLRRGRTVGTGGGGGARGESDEIVTVRIKGGLLGHWSVWTKRAVELLDRVHQAVDSGRISPELLALDSQVTDCNGALFDVANDFRGSIAGCHEVLRRQGLLEGIWCLDPNEGLSPGQAEEITRVHAAWSEMNDDGFVKQHLQRWLDGSA